MHGGLAAGAVSCNHEIELAAASLEHSRVMSVPASTTTLLGVFVSVERTPVSKINYTRCLKQTVTGWLGGVMVRTLDL